MATTKKTTKRRPIMKIDEKKKAADAIAKKLRKTIEKILKMPKPSNEQLAIGMLSRHLTIVIPNLSVGGEIWIRKREAGDLELEVRGLDMERMKKK